MLTPEELERYARHIVMREVGGPGQGKLKAARVLVIGAGGLGAPLLLYLAAAGVGTIGIVDDDTVSLSNLQRQIIHATGNIGQTKAASASAAIERLNPHVTVETHALRLAEENARGLVAAYDIVAAEVRYFHDRKLRRIAWVSTTDASGQDGEEGFDLALQRPENAGITVVDREHFAIPDLSVEAQMSRIKAANVDAIVTWAGRTLDANEDLIRKMVHERAGWILRMAGLDERLADAIMEGLRKLTIDMAIDPDHPLRAKAEEGLARLAVNLRDDPDTRARVEEWKNEMIGNKAVGDWLGGLWEKSRASLLRSARDPDAALAGKFGDALRQLGETLQTEPRLKSAINQFARRAAAGIAASYGDGIVKLVSETVRGWDTGTVTARLENAVGRDLQYIRINGTLVGGLVGLAIHSVELLA